MVNIADKDFNTDMDKYIKKRRVSDSQDPKMKEKVRDLKNNVREWRLFSMFKKRDKAQYEEEDEDYSDDEVEIEAIDEMEDELENRRESVFRRFFKKLRRKNKHEIEDDGIYEAEEEEFDLDEIKEVIKITHKWLEQLPPETIERFKRSDDFQKYKKILKRLEMIK